MEIEVQDKLELVNNKSVISCRDGIHYYLGKELGLSGDESYAKFNIYRPAEEVVKLNLEGLPVTDDHIDPAMSKPFLTYGSVKTNEIVEVEDSALQQTVMIRNNVCISDELREMIAAGKREVSLGYKSVFIDVRDDATKAYDFEQRELKPHHLAVVTVGRCGKTCEFQDAASADNNNNNNKETSMEIKDYSDAKEALNAVLSAIGSFDKTETESLKAKMRSASAKEVSDEEVEAQKAKAAQEKETADAAIEATVAKAVELGIAQHTNVLAKSMTLNVLDSAFDYNNKSAQEIMQANVLAAYPGEEFAESELATAFKTIKAVTVNHAEFADKATVTGTFAPGAFIEEGDK